MIQIVGQVSLAASSIAPVKSNIWLSADLRLYEAQQGLIQMRGARNQIDYLRGWTRFVDSIEVFWTNLFATGKSKFKAFQPWLGRFEQQRSDDQLLSYLKQARHQSQHGGISLTWGNGHVEVGGPQYSGTICNVAILSTGTFAADVGPQQGSGPFQLIHHPPKPMLAAIFDARSKREFLPPAEHMKRPILDSSPHAVALLALRYYEDLFRTVRDTFQQA